MEPARLPAMAKAPVAVPPSTEVYDEFVDTQVDSVPYAESVDSWYPGITSTELLMLTWLRKLSMPNQSASQGIALLDSIQNRELYKRAHTIQRNDDNKNLIIKLDGLGWPDKVKLCRKVQRRILETIKSSAGRLDTRPLTGLDEVEKLFAANLVVIVDVPNPRKTTGLDRPLICVPELEAKTYYHEGISPVKEENLTHSLELLMDSIGPVRILCHPDVRQWIRSCIQPQEMMAIVEDSLKRGLR